MNKILTTALLVTGMTLGISSTEAKAQHVDDHAAQLKKQVQTLYSEFARNYRHTSAYHHLMSDTAQMFRLAGHIHEVAHRGGNLRHLEADVRQLDKLYHHVEDQVADMSRRGGRHNDDLHGHRHDHDSHRGPDTRRARRLLSDIEDSIHHLHEELQDVTHRH